LSDIVDLDATALQREIRARRLSCEEVMRAHLAQVARFNPTHNAIINLRPDEDLIAEARLRDRELAQGLWHGPLHGLPQAIKDLESQRDMKMTMGSPLLKDFVPPEDSVMVERVRASGAIFIGRTNTPEFGLGSHTYNPVHGRTRNAYDPTRSAGGSSGCAGAAHAAGGRWRRLHGKPAQSGGVEQHLFIASLCRTHSGQCARGVAADNVDTGAHGAQRAGCRYAVWHPARC
jgi:amidase